MTDRLDDVSLLTGGELAAEIEAISALEFQLAARKLALIGEWDVREEWRADGHVTGSSWLTHRCSESRASAVALLRDARSLRSHPDVADAVQSIGAVRARLVVRGSTARTSAAFDRDKRSLIDAAGTLTVDQTAQLMKHWRRCADTDGAEPDDGAGELHCSRTADQTTVLHATLTGVDGWHVHETLEAVAEELYRADQACDDGRAPSTPGQRRARALIEICRRATAADPQASTPMAPLVMAVIDVPTLEGRAGRAAEVDGHGLISAGEARRLACDAHVSRLITGPDSEIVDLGRTSRVPNQAQRRVIRARDRGCATPGCAAPPGWCDIHHIAYWTEHNGRTDLNNLVMLCGAHHRMVHRDQLTIRTDDHGHHTFSRADGSVMNARPATP